MALIFLSTPDLALEIHPPSTYLALTSLEEISKLLHAKQN